MANARFQISCARRLYRFLATTRKFCASSAGILALAQILSNGTINISHSLGSNFPGRGKKPYPTIRSTIKPFAMSVCSYPLMLKVWRTVPPA
jgi:hypothetical protein